MYKYLWLGTMLFVFFKYESKKYRAFIHQYAFSPDIPFSFFAIFKYKFGCKAFAFLVFYRVHFPMIRSKV